MSADMCIMRYLLTSKQENKSRTYRDLVSHLISYSYSPDDLLFALDRLEREHYVKMNRSGSWSITQSGIDHFFRIGDE